MSESMTVEQERDKWQEIANRWLAVSNDQAQVVDALKQERDELRRLLNDAATSLETISRLAGKDEFMTDLSDIRTYAANRAKCARKANQIEGGA